MFWIMRGITPRSGPSMLGPCRGKKAKKIKRKKKRREKH
jgi:hypothetical protein